MIVGSPDDSRQRETPSDRLRDDHQIRLDVEVLHREHPPRSTESGLHFVGDQDDPVFVADPTEAFDELGGSGKEPALTLLRLEDDGRDVIRRDVRLEQPLEPASAATASIPRYRFG